MLPLIAQLPERSCNCICRSCFALSQLLHILTSPITSHLWLVRILNPLPFCVNDRRLSQSVACRFVRVCTTTHTFQAVPLQCPRCLLMRALSMMTALWPPKHSRPRQALSLSNPHMPDHSKLVCFRLYEASSCVPFTQQTVRCNVTCLVLFCRMSQHFCHGQLSQSMMTGS